MKQYLVQENGVYDLVKSMSIREEACFSLCGEHWNYVNFLWCAHKDVHDATRVLTIVEIDCRSSREATPCLRHCESQKESSSPKEWSTLKPMSMGCVWGVKHPHQHSVIWTRRSWVIWESDCSVSRGADQSGVISSWFSAWGGTAHAGEAWWNTRCFCFCVWVTTLS